MKIVIADIHFIIRSKAVPLLQDPLAKTYAPFITESMPRSPGSVKVDVDRGGDKLPPVGKYKKIFQTPDSWSLFAEGEEYLWIDTTEPSVKAPSCSARFRRGSSNIEIRCGDALMTEAEGRKMLMNPFSYPLDQFLLVYALAEREGTLLHACAVELNGKGYIFAGRSGAGKSTISEILLSRGYSVLSDDRVVVRKIGNAFSVFGTPWAGTAGIAENRSLLLQGIFFIVHAEEARAEKLSPKETFERLMPVTSILWYDEKVLPYMLSFCEDIAMNVPAYDLHFKPEEEVVNLLESLSLTLHKGEDGHA